MRIIDLKPKLIESYGSPYPRTRGRYSSSDLYFILNGMTPEEWMNGKEKTEDECMRMFSGVMMHHGIQSIFPRKDVEVRRVAQFGPVTLVAKCDYLPEDSDEVWEFKSSDVEIESAKPYQEHQARLYASMFQRGHTVIYQPTITKEEVTIKEIGRFERDDEWFMQQIGKLMVFHASVEPLWNKVLK